MNALWICVILALASPILAEENVEEKKHDKRGVIGLGYGNAHGLGYGTNYLGGHGYGYNTLGHGVALGHGLNHGYLNAPAYSTLNHAVAAPVITHASYPAPLPITHGYSGYSHGYRAPLYNTPIRVGYHGLGHNGIGNGLGHGLGHGW